MLSLKGKIGSPFLEQRNEPDEKKTQYVEESKTHILMEWDYVSNYPFISVLSTEQHFLIEMERGLPFLLSLSHTKWNMLLGKSEKSVPLFFFRYNPMSEKLI